jgi:hypothetical protein
MVLFAKSREHNDNIKDQEVVTARRIAASVDTFTTCISQMIIAIYIFKM